MSTRFLFLLVSLVSAMFAHAQENQVWLHGQVVRQADGAVIPFAQIASYKKTTLFAADSMGEFRIILDAKDKIKVVALGFESRTFFLDSINVDADEQYTFPLKQTTYQIEQVDINSNHHYNKYLSQLKAMRSKQMEMDLGLPADIELGKVREIPADIQPVFKRRPPVIAALANPLSYVHYYTSKSEKQKRNMLILLADEKQRRLLSVELIQEVSGLQGRELELFTMYCNVNIKLLNEDDETSIRYKVIDLYKAYKMETL